MTEQLTLFAEDTHANLFPQPGNDVARRMTATSGRKCLDLCGSSGPVGWLAKTLLVTSHWGSMMYLLTWKVKATPAGRLYYQLQPSAPRTGGTGFSLWATPNAADAVGSHGGGQGKSLRTEIHEWKKGAWPTPTASDGTSGAVIGENDRFTLTKNGTIRRHVQTGNNCSLSLGRIVKVWPTPSGQEAKNATLPPSQKGRDHIAGRLVDQGVSGQLNPEWVETLMGFPQGWTDINGPQDSDNPNTSGNRHGLQLG